MQKLLRFALDDDAPDTIALAAIRDALDRAGLIAPKTVDVAIGTRPFEQIFDAFLGWSSGGHYGWHRSSNGGDGTCPMMHPGGMGPGGMGPGGTMAPGGPIGPQQSPTTTAPTTLRP